MASLLVSFGATVGTAALVGGILMFGDPDGDGVLGWLARMLTVTGPRVARRVLTAVGLWWVCDSCGRCLKWFMFKPHPIIQIAYLALVVGCYAVFVIHGYPLIPNSYMAGYHRWIGAAVFVGCLITFAMASFVDPGTITPANVEGYLADFPADHFLYAPGRQCETCHVPKVPRSKHCRVCDRCVSKFDHHCIWLNNCVGQRNYRWFLAYLTLNSVLMLYGMVGAGSIFAHEIATHNLFQREFVNVVTGQRMAAGYAIVFQYLLFHFSELMMVTFMATVMGLIVTGFTLYHYALAMWNVTTNETYKWKEAHWHRDQAVEEYGKAVEEAKAARADGGAAPIQPPVPMPDNLYDVGVWANVVEVLRGRPAPRSTTATTSTKPTPAGHTPAPRKGGSAALPSPNPPTTAAAPTTNSKKRK